MILAETSASSSDYLGYLHASVGDQFNVYRRTAGAMDDWLGKYRLEEGVMAILRACGRTADESGRDAVSRGGGPTAPASSGALRA